MSPGLYALLIMLVAAGTRAVPGLANIREQALDGVLIAAATPWDSAGVAALRSGVSSRLSDPAASAAAFERAARLLPGLSDWSRLLGAESAARRGDTATVARLMGGVEPGFARQRGWRIASEARRVAGDLPGAIREVEASVALLMDSTTRAEALLRLGRLRLAGGDAGSARDAWRLSIATAAGSGPALEAARALAALPSAVPLDRLTAGRVFFRHSVGDQGLAGFDAYLRLADLSDQERLAVRLEAAIGLVNSRRYAQADPRLKALAKETSHAAISADARIAFGRLEIRQGRTDAAIRTLRIALDGTPSDELHAFALFALADLEHDQGAVGRAANLYRVLIDRHPSSDEAAEGAIRLGSLEYAAGRYASAAAIFDAFLAAHPTGARALQAGFWAGQAWLFAGDTAASVARLEAVVRTDPASYYGLRAGEIMGQALRDALAPTPVSTASERTLAKGAAERIALLDRVGLAADATIEANRVKRHLENRIATRYALAEALHAAGRMVDAVRLGREIQRTTRTWDERLLRIVYPMPFRREIVTAARQRGLDPWLVAGLIRQESLFDAAARSSAGAVGLMQILPPTGRELARKEGIARFTSGMLRDPTVNVRLGTLFFAELLRRNGGSLPHALAAYNAGPSRVARWRRNPESADPDVFAERIPFAETRDYVRIVQQNARIYAALYGQEGEAAQPGRVP